MQNEKVFELIKTAEKLLERGRLSASDEEFDEWKFGTFLYLGKIPNKIFLDEFKKLNFGKDREDDEFAYGKPKTPNTQIYADLRKTIQILEEL